MLTYEDVDTRNVYHVKSKGLEGWVRLVRTLIVDLDQPISF